MPPQNGTDEDDDQQRDTAEAIGYLTREFTRLRTQVQMSPAQAAAPAPSYGWVAPVVCILSVVATSFINVGRYQQSSDAEQQRIAQIQVDTKERFTEVWNAIHTSQLQSSTTTQSLVELQSDMRYVKQWVDRQDRERQKP